LQTVNHAIWKEERREALVLQIRHGLSIAEIAGAPEVSEDAVEWRLHMAKEDLKADDDEKKSRAFLGYGSLEALAEALRPEPIPEERGVELWKRITEQIRQQQGDATDGTGPSSSFPPAAVALATAPTLAPAAVLTFTTAKLAAIIAATFVGGAVAGAGGLLAWQANDDKPHGREAHAIEARGIEARTVQPASAPLSSSRGSSPGNPLPSCRSPR